MASIYVYKGGNLLVTPANILGSIGLTLTAMVPNAWYAQCGCAFAAPLTVDEKAQLDAFMASQAWVYVRQDDTFTGFVQKRLEGWLNVALAAGLVAVPCARYGLATLTDQTMPRAGSVVGLQARLTAPVAAGTLTAQVEIGGVVIAALTVTLDAATQDGFVRAAIGAHPYAAGERLRVLVSTDGLFAAPGAIFDGTLEAME